MGDYEKWFEYFKKIGWQDDKTVVSVDSVFQEQGYEIHHPNMPLPGD